MMIVNEELLNVMGSFSETALDCIEKQNEEIEDLKKENARLKEIENKLNFIKNRVKQGMSQENINKCAIELVNSYLKEN